MKITGVYAVKKALATLGRKARGLDSSVIVGFTQNYAVYVHENLRAKHPVGQYKFLETPARLLQKELASIIKQAYKATGSLRDGLLTAGMRLQREAQKLTPVDTGALKASAFTAFDEDVEQKAGEAYARSERIRKAAKKKKKRGKK